MAYVTLTAKFAAAAGLAAALWIMPARASDNDAASVDTPAVTAAPIAQLAAPAAETAPRAAEAAPDVSRAYASIDKVRSRRASRAGRNYAAASYRSSRGWSERSECYGVWCGRQFVLMLGVGF